MRHATVLLLTALLALAAPTAVAGGVDGPYVESASHDPAEPAEGDDVIVTVGLAPDVEAESVFLTHCRVDPSYACSAKSSAMTETEEGVWTATIPWQPHFFQGTTWVGYTARVVHANGTETNAPLESVPFAPDGLPDGAGHYYFYQVAGADAAPAPAPGVLVMLVLLGALAVAARRRAA